MHEVMIEKIHGMSEKLNVYLLVRAARPEMHDDKILEETIQKIAVWRLHHLRKKHCCRARDGSNHHCLLSFLNLESGSMLKHSVGISRFYDSHSVQEIQFCSNHGRIRTEYYPDAN